MIWYQELYIGEGIGSKAARVKWKINHNAGQIDIYIITLASNRENLMDIIPATELLQRAYPKRNLYVIGLARGYEEAVMLAADIVTEVFQNTQTTDVRNYILQRDKGDHR